MVFLLEVVFGLTAQREKKPPLNATAGRSGGFLFQQELSAAIAAAWVYYTSRMSRIL